MQEPYMIMGTGFKNTRSGGAVTGYQVNVRIPYYRGVFLSSIESVSLAVDGAPVSRDSIRIVVNGKDFSLDAAEDADQVRWGFGDPATLRVSKSGGLRPGQHAITVGMAIRKSYLPSTDPEHLYDFFGLWSNGVYKTFMEPPTIVTKKMTLVA